MKPTTLLARLIVALMPCIAASAQASPLQLPDRPANTYFTRGFACYGTSFAEIDSLNALPPALLASLKKRFGNAGISDRGGRFNPGDVIFDDTPQVRFIIGALNKDVALLALERGGIGHNVGIWSFLRKGDDWEEAPAESLPYQMIDSQRENRNADSAATNLPAGQPSDLKAATDSAGTKARQDFDYFLPQAQQALGCKERPGQGKTDSDADLAKVLQREAQRGDADAQFALAHLYANGRGVPKNPTQAQSWFSRAATTHADMQYDLGYFYANGIDLPQNYTAAMHWFRLSAGAQDEDLRWPSYFQMGMLYADGKGVAANKVAAYALLLTAQYYSPRQSDVQTETLEKSMSKEEIERAVTLNQQMYQEAQEKGTVLASLDAFLAHGKLAAQLIPQD